MAITYGFYNSMNGDRKYDAVQLSSIFDGVIRDGVFQSIGGYLATKPGTGMQVIVSPGKAWFDHTWTVNDADLPLEIAQSDLTLSRYDAVVLETDATKSVRENSIKVIKGTPASSPQKPTLTNEGDVHQHPLAYILVPGGASSIQVQNIDIMVGKTECPFVTSILESVSIEALLAKWEGEFRVWFDELQNQMAGDVATNLQNQITRNAPSVGDIAYSYSPKKTGPWLICGGLNYDKEKYPKLHSLMKRETSLTKGWNRIPLVESVLHIHRKSFYFSEGNNMKSYDVQPSLLIYPAELGDGPNYDLGFDLYELGFDSSSFSVASLKFSYANGYYVIYTYYSNNINVAFSVNGSNWTYRTISVKTDNSGIYVQTIDSLEYIGDKCYFVVRCTNNYLYFVEVNIVSDVELTVSINSWIFNTGTDYGLILYHTRDGKILLTSSSPTGDTVRALLVSAKNGILVKENSPKPPSRISLDVRVFEQNGSFYAAYVDRSNDNAIYKTDLRVAKYGNSGTGIVAAYNFLYDRTMYRDWGRSAIDVLVEDDHTYIICGHYLFEFANGKLTLLEDSLARVVGAELFNKPFTYQAAHIVTGSVKDRIFIGAYALLDDHDNPIDVGCSTNSPEITPYVETENGEYAYIRSE